MVDSVIFDCDGTLLDSMPAWHAMQEGLAQKAGVVLNPLQLVRLNANTLPQTAAFFHEECGLGASTEAVLEDARNALLEAYRTRVSARNGAVELVRRLSRDGVKLAIVSSSPDEFLRAGLERAGIYCFFDVVASAQDEGKTKNDPLFSEGVAYRLRANPENSWCVDDSAYALRAMAKAGFMTLAIYDSDNAGTKEDLREIADSFINGFEELDYECFVRGWKRENVAIR